MYFFGQFIWQNYEFDNEIPLYLCFVYKLTTVKQMNFKKHNKKKRTAAATVCLENIA